MDDLYEKEGRKDIKPNSLEYVHNILFMERDGKGCFFLTIGDRIRLS